MRRSAVLAAVLLALVPAGEAAAADAPANVQGDAAHTGHVQTDLAPPIGKRWVREDLGDVIGPPVIAEGKVFVVAGPDDSSRYENRPTTTRLYALDAGSGATLWSQPVLLGTVAYGDGQVYAITAETTFQAFDAATGAARWTRQFPQDQGLEGPPTAADGEVYVHGDRFYALSAADGSDRWYRDGEGNAVALSEDRVFGATDYGAVAFDRRLGLRLWEHSGDVGGSDYALPVAADGLLHVAGGYDGVVLEQADGRLVRGFTGNPPAVAGGRAFQVLQDAIRAVDARTGAPVWERALSETPRSLPLVLGGIVVVRVGLGGLLGLDAATGEERFRSFTRVERSASRSFWIHGGIAARGDRLVAPFPGKLIGYGPGPDAPGLDPDPFRAPGAVRLVLNSGRTSHRAAYPRAYYELEGEYQRVTGDEADDSPIELQVDGWPFGDGWTTTERESPEHRLDLQAVRPDRNTRYRLLYAGVDPPATSDTFTFWVELGLRVRYRWVARRRLRAAVRIRGPADALARPMRFHFYLLRRKTNRATRLRSVRLRRRATARTGRVTLRIPRNVGRRDLVFGCYRERVPDAWGEPIEALRYCGRRRI